MKQWKCTVCKQVFEGEAPPVPCPVCGAAREAFVPAGETPRDYRRDSSEAYVLVGGGLATIEAAKAIRKRDQTGAITIVSGEAQRPYHRTALNRVLGDSRSPESLALVKDEFYTDNHIDLRCCVKAERIDLSQNQLVLEGGERLPYTKLLLATGSYPFNPIQQGYNTIPVRVLRSYEDAIGLAGEAKGKRIVVVGGGILGLEAACALRGAAASVTVVELADRILPLQTDEEASAMLQAELAALDVDLIAGESVQTTTATGIVMSGGVEMDADLLLASLGVRSEVGLALAIGLELSRGIIVDEFMRTSKPGIWAAGDCAEYAGSVQARAGAAMAMGAAAGASMAGDQTAPYTPYVPATIFNCGGYALFSAGKINERAEETAVYRNEPAHSYRRLFFEAGRLAGALFVGESPGVAAVRAVEQGAPLAEALPLLGPRA